VNTLLIVFVSVFLGLLALVSYLYFSDPTPDELKIDQELFPYQSRFLALESGSRLHYLDEGEGQTLLLLHGNPTWSFLYRHIVSELRDEFRLVVPDYPGFGLSTAASGYGFTPAEHAGAVDALLQQLDLRDVIVMVQDWGGPIGFDVALKNPERIKGFVIGNTWAWPMERPGHKAFSALMGGWPGQFGAWCCNGVVRFFMSRGVATGLSDPELAMYLGPFSRRDSRSPTHVFPAQLRDAHELLASIFRDLNGLSDRPVLLVWGTKDFAFQAPERERFEALFPEHETVLLKDAGHFIQEDAPREIAAAIRGWHGRRF
jgi:haloalkane dehalogenase